ncbi:Rab2a [Hexamita inflata]|uniref:Rab2a n=1 Tax=Hexamita inflata TaxID=28002 RepID=A0ABP1HIS4_9EUKA
MYIQIQRPYYVYSNENFIKSSTENFSLTVHTVNYVYIGNRFSMIIKFPFLSKPMITKKPTTFFSNQISRALQEKRYISNFMSKSYWDISKHIFIYNYNFQRQFYQKGLIHSIYEPEQNEPFKAIIVGTFGNGTSTLFNQLINNNKFIVLGIEFEQIIVNYKNQNVKLQIWTKYSNHQKLPSYYANTNVVIIVFNINEIGSFYECQTYIEEIKICTNAYIILVGQLFSNQRNVSNDEIIFFAEINNMTYTEISYIEDNRQQINLLRQRIAAFAFEYTYSQVTQILGYIIMVRLYSQEKQSPNIIIIDEIYKYKLYCSLLIYNNIQSVKINNYQFRFVIILIYFHSSQMLSQQIEYDAELKVKYQKQIRNGKLQIYNSSFISLNFVNDFNIDELSIDNSNIINLNINNHRIKKLSVCNCLLRSTNGLQFLNNLEILNLSNNIINNIEQIKNMNKLTKIVLSNNNIRDISVLKAMQGLFDLDLSGNASLDVEPLSQMTQLVNLDLSSVNLVDTKSFISLINLKSLNMSNNQKIDISSISELISLRNLVIRSVLLTDMTPLIKIHLLTLDISHNNVNISQLKLMSSLTHLNLRECQISDIVSLEGLLNLQDLNVSGNPLSNILPLKNLTELISLDLSCCKIEDLSALKNLRKLENLNIFTNSIVDISSLQNIKSLRTLDASQNQILSIYVLKNLKNLQIVRLESNKIIYINTLQVLTQLNELTLSGNQILDASLLNNQNSQYLTFDQSQPPANDIQLANQFLKIYASTDTCRNCVQKRIGIQHSIKVFKQNINVILNITYETHLIFLKRTQTLFDKNNEIADQ